MKAITPHLWFDKEAAEAAELYVSSIADSKIKSRQNDLRHALGRLRRRFLRTRESAVYGD